MRQIRRPSNDEPGIDSNTMPADASPVLKNIHPRVTVRQADQLSDINTVAVANQ
jgi:hypothetical protein